MASACTLDIRVRVDSYGFERMMACVAAALDPATSRRDCLIELSAIAAMTEIQAMADIARAELGIGIGETIRFALRLESESPAP